MEARDTVVVCLWEEEEEEEKEEQVLMKTFEVYNDDDVKVL